MQRYTRIAAAAWRRVGDETVVVHLERNVILGLDELGGRVWKALAEPVTVEELVRAVHGGEATPEARARVVRFVERLVAEGLVEGGDERAREPVALRDGGAGPRVLWRDEVHRAAGGCTFNPAGSLICDQQPFNS